MAPAEEVRPADEPDGDEWQFDQFNEGVMKDVKKIQQQQLQTFVDDYAKQVRRPKIRLTTI